MRDDARHGLFHLRGAVAEFSERIAPLGIINGGRSGRIDTLMHYSDATWQAMARSGLKMVFSGAESASDDKSSRR